MKVIKPLDLIGAHQLLYSSLPSSTPSNLERYLESTQPKLLYSNAINTISVWNSTTKYIESTEEYRIIVYKSGSDSGFYESVKGSINSEPTPNNVNWKYLGETFDDLPVNDVALPFWASGVTFDSPDIVEYRGYYYAALESNINIAPDTPGTTAWIKLKPNNALAQFDNEISTATVGNTLLTFTASTPNITAIGLVNPIGKKVIVTCKNYTNDSGNWKIFNNANSNNQDYDPTITNNLYGIVYAPGLNILVTGGEGVIAYSTNAGNTWTNATLPDTITTITDICFSNEKSIFVAVGYNSLNIPVVWYSTTGKIWYNATISFESSNVNISNCIYVAGNTNKFIIAVEGTTPVAYTSTDGITWLKKVIFSQGTQPNFLVPSKIFYDPYKSIVILCGKNLTSSAADSQVISSDGGETWIKSQWSIESSIIDAVWDPVYARFLILLENGKVRNYNSLGFGSNPSITDWDVSSFTDENNNLITDSPIPNLCAVIRLPSEKEFLNPIPTPPAPIKYIGITTTGKIYKFELYTYFLRDIEEISASTIQPLNYIYYSLAHNAIFIVGDYGTRISSSIVYNEARSLNNSFVEDWDGYFFNESEPETELAFLLGIPNYSNNQTTITIVSDYSENYIDRKVSLGTTIIGNEITLGTTQWGASVGIIDYSKKETDEFGTTTFIERAFSKRIDVNLILPSRDLNKLQRILSSIRATPCMWVSTQDSIYNLLIVFGFYRDFNIEIPYPEYSYCSLQIEGLA